MITVFDIFGDFGHFRVPYTTTSPLTFPFPPKVSIYGIISAILGIDKNIYLESFQDKSWYVGVTVKEPIKKILISENFINTKVAKKFSRMVAGKSSRTRIRMEFLKNPNYRIYVSTKSELLEKLIDLLKEHKTTFTISLGISECLANIKYIGTYNAIKLPKPEDFLEINSVLPTDLLSTNTDLNVLTTNRKYTKVHMTTEFTPDRKVLETKYFLVETNAYSILSKPNEYYRIEELNENITLF